MSIKANAASICPARASISFARCRYHSVAVQEKKNEKVSISPKTPEYRRHSQDKCTQYNLETMERYDRALKMAKPSPV